ncbi:site-specific DNA-methyltransferase [bacterium]|nr:site-specific DNA-methyltransferase [bacterium]
MTGKSLNITEDKINQFKAIIPEAFTEGKVDWEKLKAALGDSVEFRDERYVLNWAGKSDAFRVLQAPTTATLVPDKDESVRFDETQNLFIEGENLEVLKVLQKAYFGKVKMIYIDPPYNTGNDSFIYPDRFAESREDYLTRVGDKDETGYLTREGLFRKNSKDSGHYHSNWLSMMYPRLFLARNLLRDDGVIFISIDDNEVHNLRLLMNEVFGEENFLSQFVWRTDGNFDNQAKVKNCHEYVLTFCKDISKFPHPPVVDPNIKPDSKLFKETIRNTIVKNGPKNPESDITLPIGFPSDIENGVIKKRDDAWPRYKNDAIIKNGKLKKVTVINSGWSSKDLILKFIKNNCKPIIDQKGQNTTFTLSKTGAVEVIKERIQDQSHVISVLTNMGGTQKASNELDIIEIKFDYPKPTNLLKYLTSFNTGEEFIVLDFFAGSGTTAHAILDLNQVGNGNRHFIMVQMPEACDEKSEAFKAGYKTIADIGKERIRRVIKQIESEKEGKLDLDGGTQDLGFKVLKLRKSNFKIWRSDGIENGDALEKQLDSFKDPVKKDATTEDILYELLLKSGVQLTANIQQKDGYYLVNGELILALERMDADLVKTILNEKPEKVITLDRLFEGNDPLKTNTALQMKDAGVEFKTI